MEFVPLWTDIIEGPNWKIIDLPADLYRFWTFCLMSAQRHDYADGYLPDSRTLAHWCQMDRDTCVTLRDKLVTCGLIDRDMPVTSAGQDRDMPVTGHESVTNDRQDGAEYKMHDWDQWRLVKDPGAKGRKRTQRKKAKDVIQHVTDESRACHGLVTGLSQHVTHQQTTHSIQQATNNTHTEESVCVDDDIEPFQSPTEAIKPAWTPEQKAVFDKAEKWWGASNGDSIVGGLLDMYPAMMVNEAIDSHHGKVGNHIDRGRLEGLCRKIWDEGKWRPKPSTKSGASEPTPKYYTASKDVNELYEREKGKKT